MDITFVEDLVPEREAILQLYRANGWTAAAKPDALIQALENSHHVIAAYGEDQLVGLANAISDGHLVVYYPHLLVHPHAQDKGIGRALMNRMLKRYEHMHQHMVIAVADAVGFYERVGFERAGETVAMWIYEGGDA